MLGVFKSSASAACTVAKSLLNNNTSLVNQQIRTTVILRRKFPPLLHKKGKAPHKFKNRQFIYEVVENTATKQPAKPLDIILTQYVEGFGEKGEKLSMKPNKAYHDFLLPGLAVYASPENIDKYLTHTKVEKSCSSITAPTTVRRLKHFCLLVHMSIENPWVIEKWHIRAMMRQGGYHVTDESITLPEREISGPNLDNEGKEFYVTITINKTEEVKVRCRLYHVSSDVTKQLEPVPEYWKIPGEAIFPEDQEVLDSMPRPSFEESSKKSSDN